MQSRSALSSSMTASTCAWVAVAGRSRRILVIPICAQSRCLAPTYQELAGSWPTSTVPSPGTIPRDANALTRCASSALIAANVALPSRMRALTHRSCHGRRRDPGRIRASSARRCGTSQYCGCGTFTNAAARRHLLGQSHPLPDQHGHHCHDHGGQQQPPPHCALPGRPVRLARFAVYAAANVTVIPVNNQGVTRARVEMSARSSATDPDS